MKLPMRYSGTISQLRLDLAAKPPTYITGLMLDERLWEVCEEFIRNWRHHTTFNNRPGLPTCFCKLFVRTESLHRFNAIKFDNRDEFCWVFSCCPSKQKLHTHSSHFLFLRKNHLLPMVEALGDCNFAFNDYRQFTLPTLSMLEPIQVGCIALHTSRRLTRRAAFYANRGSNIPQKEIYVCAISSIYQTKHMWRSGSPIGGTPPHPHFVPAFSLMSANKAPFAPQRLV